VVLPKTILAQWAQELQDRARARCPRPVARCHLAQCPLPAARCALPVALRLIRAQQARVEPCPPAGALLDPCSGHVMLPACPAPAAGMRPVWQQLACWLRLTPAWPQYVPVMPRVVLEEQGCVRADEPSCALPRCRQAPPHARSFGRRRWPRSGGCACWRTGTRRASVTARTLRRWPHSTSSCAPTASWSTTARSRARRAALSGARAPPQQPAPRALCARTPRGPACGAAAALRRGACASTQARPRLWRISFLGASHFRAHWGLRCRACAHTSARQSNMSSNWKKSLQNKGKK